eukprot:Em0614g1a
MADKGRNASTDHFGSAAIEGFNKYRALAASVWIKFIAVIHAREFLAEMFCDFPAREGKGRGGVKTIGNGAVAQVILGATASSFDFGSQLSITSAMVIPYWAAQLLGAFLSSVMIFGVYQDALYAVDCHGSAQLSVNCTGGIFASYPQPYLSLGTGFMDQFFGTFLLLLGIFGITDVNNNEAKQGMKPVLVGMLITAVGLSYGLNCGYCHQPSQGTLHLVCSLPYPDGDGTVFVVSGSVASVLCNGREFLAEMFATFMLVTMGNGAVAQVILGATASTFDFGSQLSINLGYGLGGMIGAFIAGGVTGAHMNPAVTLAMALRGKLNWKECSEGTKVIPYWFAQLLGAFLSAAMIYWVYYDALMAVNCHGYGQKSVNCTAGIWASYPQPYLSLGTGFMDQ